MNMQKSSIIAYVSIGAAILLAVLAALGIRPADLTPEQIAAISAVVTALAGLAHAKTGKTPPSQP